MCAFTKRPRPAIMMHNKVSKGAKIRNRYNQVPQLTQDTNVKVTNLLRRSTKEVPPWNGKQTTLLEGLNWFNSANLTLNSDVDQDT